MKVGILSDTHDNLNAIRAAVKVFKEEQVELILHAGDFVAPFTLPFYLDSGIEFRGVFGNNDGDHILLHRRSGGRIYSAPYEFEYQGTWFILNHYPDAVDAMARGRGIGAVIFGHTHEPEIRKQDDCLIINPGECGGWTSGRSTVALLDLATRSARIIPISF